MRARRWIVAGLGLALLLCVTGAAAASPGGDSQIAAATKRTAERASGGPRMLANNGTSQFVRRPATVTPYGNGAAISTIIGRIVGTKRGKPIHWVTWTRTAAYGRGTMWENDMTPSIAEGHWHGHGVKLYAHRVVHGRYTRLTLRDQVDGQARTQSLGLLRLGEWGYAWRTLVPVPSWRDFPSSYTGDDFFAGLESLKAAIEAGFEDAGLVADVVYVNGMEVGHASQHPKTGSRVPEGTTVHIRIPVID